MARATPIDLNLDGYNQGFRYYPLMVTLNRFNGSFNTFDDSSCRVCVPNKAEEVNVNVFNMITKIKKSKSLRKYISCICKCKVDEIKCRVKNYIWSLSTCTC